MRDAGDTQDTRPWSVGRDVLPNQRTSRRVGDILRRRGAVTYEHVEQAALEQNIGDDRLIGQILIAQGLLRPDQLESALIAQGPVSWVDPALAGERRRLARVLVDLGLVDEATVTRALQRQSDGDRHHLGEILEQEGVLAPAELEHALDVQEQSLELPAAPSDEERISYVGRNRWIAPVQWLAFGGAALSMWRFTTTSPLLYPLLATFVFTAFYFALGVNSNIAGKGRFDLGAHDARVAKWSGHPSVDVMLPTCGEDLAVLDNTWRHVAALDYDGPVTVWCLDDADRIEVRELAQQYGFRYLARPTHEFKKAGNLRFAFNRSHGEFIVILDADFAPRADFLTELLPYTDDPTVGIVQSPQYFDVAKPLGWLQQGAGAVQQLFYRHTQTGRSALGAAICVGSNAVYRRSALEAIGGPVQIEHSEDVHTGFQLMAAGFRTLYVPLALAKGLCPSGLRSFFNQQYRWCAGSMSLVATKSFWTTKMSLRQRMCFLSGFSYYVHTGLWTFIGPLPALLVVWRFPHLVALRNYLPLLPGVLSIWVLFPLWHKGSYPRLAVERTRLVYGYAHLFAIVDHVTGRTQEWATTGAETVRKGRYAPFRRLHLAWSSLVVGGLAAGIGLRVSQGFDPLAFAPLAAFTLVGGWQAVRIRRAGRELVARHAAAPAAPPVFIPAPRAQMPSVQGVW